MKVNFDSLAINQTYVIGTEVWKKVSPMTSQNVKTGELIHDARLCKDERGQPQYPNAKAPLVECPQFDRGPILSVIEYSSFFAVQHNPSGQQRAMGDGVDTLFDEEGNALLPGTPGFIEAWEKALNAEVQETLQAYWGDEQP